MPLYKRLEDTIETNDDDIQNNENNESNDTQRQVNTDREKTWEKRYADLRSYSQKQVNELTEQIRNLEKQINTKQQPNFPKTQQDLQEWAKKYPDVYGMLKTMIGYDLQEATKELNTRFEDIEKDRKENAKTAAINAIVAAHPDFDDLEGDQGFHDWLGSKSKRTQDAIYENETDALAAIEVLDLYKLETGKNKKTAAKPSARDTARDVNINAARATPTFNKQDYDFTESQINAMSIREYEKYEDDIEEARRKGRIFMDMSGAAR